MIKYHLSAGIKILFIGINPSFGTWRRRIPFSGNKTFWYHLHKAGLIAEDRTTLKDDKKLKELYYHKFTQKYHLAILNVVNRPSRTCAELKLSETGPGRRRILAAIKKYKPLIVCFVGKTAYRLFTGVPHCDYGWKESIDSSKLYVMRNPLHVKATDRIAELKKIKKAAGL